MSQHHRGGRASQAMTAAVLEEYGPICHLCGKPGATTRDHLLPLSRGGVDTLDNCRPAHQRCNAKRGARDLTPALMAELRGESNVRVIVVDVVDLFEAEARTPRAFQRPFSSNGTQENAGIAGGKP